MWANPKLQLLSLTDVLRIALCYNKLGVTLALNQLSWIPSVVPKVTRHIVKPSAIGMQLIEWV